MAGILINTRFALIVTLINSLTIIILGYLQSNNITILDLRWKTEVYDTKDALVFSATLGIIAIVSWLHNREIERALHRCLESETALQKERDTLEIKVEDRTKELKKTQIEKITQLYRLAEYGRMASGILHDLANPLTIVSLHLEESKNQCGEELNAIKANITKAMAATRRMENFITSTRKLITNQEHKIFFSLTEEIIQIIQMLGNKAKKAQVDILFSPMGDIKTYGDTIKFSQLISNLISNAIDAYDKIPENRERREIEVKLFEKNNIINLSVKDWGCGMPQEELKKIFQPLYTTKGFDKGTGIGLSTVKDIVYKDFRGKMKVGSRVGKGSIFIVQFPKIKNQQNNTRI